MSKKALKLSIKHWENNLEKVKKKTLPDLGAGSCALCLEYIDDKCANCPIALKTNKISCYDTPYYTVEDSIDNTTTEKGWKILKKAVKKELQFLRNLKYE